MHSFASFNLKIQTPEQINLSAISSAAFYGRGVFTTLAIYDEKPFLWEKHWRRLTENAAKIKLDISRFSEDDIDDALRALINQNQIKNARARITFFDESASGIWKFATNRTTSVLITTADFQATKDFHLTVSPYPINSKSPLANVKSCNYLENVLALEAAKAENFDEAVRLNERGEITSACMANLFWIKGEQIFTPALETGCLAGTTREFLMEKVSVQEVKAKMIDLHEADEIFLTSAGLGICPTVFGNKKNKSVSAIYKLNKILDFRRVKT
jgi:branched-subunit amino acid aminotransferase/4-amino-4-deoxychorismate lyase